VGNVSVLNVLLYGMPVGTITRVDGDRTLFAFNDAYINDESRPTLSLGFKDHLGRLTTELSPVQTRVMPFFSNLLPEGRMRTYLAERAGVNPQRRSRSRGPERMRCAFLLLVFSSSFLRSKRRARG
jgi:serine/threonine-protein kinase HipA